MIAYDISVKKEGFFKPSFETCSVKLYEEAKKLFSIKIGQNTQLNINELLKAFKEVSNIRHLINHLFLFCKEKLFWCMLSGAPLKSYVQFQTGVATNYD